MPAPCAVAARNLRVSLSARLHNQAVVEAACLLLPALRSAGLRGGSHYGVVVSEVVGVGKCVVIESLCKI